MPKVSGVTLKKESGELSVDYLRTTRERMKPTKTAAAKLT